MEENKLQKIEEGIFENIKDKIKNTSKKEIKSIIQGAVREANYLSEDWQIDYAVERIISIQKEKKEVEKQIQDKGAKLTQRKILRIILRCIIFFFFFYLVVTLLSIIFFHTKAQ